MHITQWETFNSSTLKISPVPPYDWADHIQVSMLAATSLCLHQPKRSRLNPNPIEYFALLGSSVCASARSQDGLVSCFLLIICFRIVLLFSALFFFSRILSFFSSFHSHFLSIVFCSFSSVIYISYSLFFFPFFCMVFLFATPTHMFARGGSLGSWWASRAHVHCTVPAPKTSAPDAALYSTRWCTPVPLRGHTTVALASRRTPRIESNDSSVTMNTNIKTPGYRNSRQCWQHHTMTRQRNKTVKLNKFSVSRLDNPTKHGLLTYRTHCHDRG